MTDSTPSAREVIDAAFPSMTGLGALVIAALAAQGYRLAGPDEAVVTWNELDAISTQIFNTIMQDGDWKAACRKSREMVDALKARAAEEDKA